MVPHTLYGMWEPCNCQWLLWSPLTLYGTGIVWSPHMYDMIFFQASFKRGPLRVLINLVVLIGYVSLWFTKCSFQKIGSGMPYKALDTDIITMETMPKAYFKSYILPVISEPWLVKCTCFCWWPISRWWDLLLIYWKCYNCLSSSGLDGISWFTALCIWPRSIHWVHSQCDV